MPQEAQQPLVLPVVETVPQVRFSDTDMMGHVSSMSYAAWGEVARADFFAAVHEERIPWFVLVRLELDFHREGRFGDPFRITTRCVAIGEKSMTLEHRITVNEKPVCTIKVVMAGFDVETRKAIAIPAHWRPSED
jgi:YbgC/YbaW family acyl-CoA thioester hydrolase